SAPKKQRHTARRVHQRLVAEHGADIGESTVREPVTMPAAWLAHADQLQAEQAELVPLLEGMGAETQ
ncbi:MAG: IS21 family transposase, partial [Actinomycetota bacterium]|nr:IS21 family transposase [Actinomycetota bacterium]